MSTRAERVAGDAVNDVMEEGLPWGNFALKSAEAAYRRGLKDAAEEVSKMVLENIREASPVTPVLMDAEHRILRLADEEQP